MYYVLYVHNKDSKGRPKGYGQIHATKKSALNHRKNLRIYYAKNPRDLFGTRIVKKKGNPPKRGLSSKQIMAKIFGK